MLYNGPPPGFRDFPYIVLLGPVIVDGLLPSQSALIDNPDATFHCTGFIVAGDVQIAPRDYESQAMVGVYSPGSSDVAIPIQLVGGDLGQIRPNACEMVYPKNSRVICDFVGVV